MDLTSDNPPAEAAESQHGWAIIKPPGAKPYVMDSEYVPAGESYEFVSLGHLARYVARIREL